MARALVCLYNSGRGCCDAIHVLLRKRRMRRCAVCTFQHVSWSNAIPHENCCVPAAGCRFTTNTIDFKQTCVSQSVLCCTRVARLFVSATKTMIVKAGAIFDHQHKRFRSVVGKVTVYDFTVLRFRFTV